MNRRLNIFKAALSAIALITIVSGCSGERDVFYTTYAEEMISFIEDSPTGRQIFSTDIYSDEPFTFDDSMVIFLNVDSHSRNYGVNIAGGPRDIESFLEIYDAIVDIADVYSGHAWRIIDDDTLVLGSWNSIVNRTAYFLKIYRDNYQYHGWRFWGYATHPDPPIRIGSLASRSGTTFIPNYTGPRPNRHLEGVYIQKNDIPLFIRGDSLTYNAGPFDSVYNYIFAPTGRSLRDVLPVEKIGNDKKAGWRTPSSTDIYYNLITFNGFMKFYLDTVLVDSVVSRVDTVLLKSGDIVIPYRTEID